MVTDSEPRYRLVDGNGNPVGSVYAEPDGTLKLQEGSGSDNEAVLQPDGTLSVPAVNTENVTITDIFKLDDSTETISSGSIPYTSPTIRVDAPSSSETDLTNITGGSDNDIVILTKTGGDDITVVDESGGSGQILLDSDGNFIMDNSTDRLMLQYDDSFDTWNEISTSNS